MPWFGAASAGCTASAATAQARISAARPLTRAIPRSCNAKRTTALLGKDQPVGPGAGRNAVGERNAQPSGGDVAFPQQRRQDRKTLSRHRRMAFVRLVLETDAGPPKHRLVRRDTIVREPLLPPFV